VPGEAALETVGRQDAEGRFPSSELKAGCRKRASAEPARACPEPRAQRPYQQVLPPLTAIVWPVTKAASSLARYTAAQPTSAGVPQRPIGTLAR
jgi:hypothetical protein